MKKHIQLSVLLMPLISFGAAFQHQKIQLTEDPIAEVVNMAMSSNGAHAAFILQKQIPEKKAQKIRMRQQEKNE